MRLGTEDELAGVFDPNLEHNIDDQVRIPTDS